MDQSSYKQIDGSQRRATGSRSGNKAQVWRVIAPYITLSKKKEKEIEEDDQFSIHLRRKPDALVNDLSCFMSDSVDLPSMFHETAHVLQVFTKASGVNLYMVEKNKKEMYLSTTEYRGERYKVKWKIEEGTTVAAFVASVKDYVLIEDLLKDERFPEGVGSEDLMIKSVLCLPIVTLDGDCYAVIELYRGLFEEAFNTEHLRTGIMMTAWIGVAISQNEARLALRRQRELNDYLINLITSYFGGENVLEERLMVEVVKFAKHALRAERGSFFLIDHENNEMIGHLFDENDVEQIKKNQNFRFGRERGIAGLVATSGITMNIKDAYEDSRFYRGIDEKTGYKTRSILCMPVQGRGEVLGVVQVINKTDGSYFTAQDEALFQTFSLYCSFALHFTKSLSQIKKLTRLNNINRRLFNLQKQPCIHEYMNLVETPTTTIPSDFDEFTWYFNSTVELRTSAPQYCLYIFFKLIDPSDINMDDMIKFILTVRKLYRDNPYHSFEHAFNVYHCMYCILLRNYSLFTELEIKALTVATICHDIDHCGFTNSFLSAINDDLAQLYENSILENHHYQITMMILKDYNLYPNLSKTERTMFLEEIHKLIIATDLALYFENKLTLTKILNKDGLDWTNYSHRDNIKALMMTACDLSGQCKPFLTAIKLTDAVYREFYNQGDLEKAMGLCPLPIMDRDKQHRVPDDQIHFLKVIVIACVEMLQKILPNTSDLNDGATAMMNFWQEIKSARGKKIWRQDESVVRK